MATPRSCFVQALLDTPSPLPHLTRHGDGAGGHVTDVRSTARPRDAPPARPSARGTLSLYKKPKLVVVVPYTAYGLTRAQHPHAPSPTRERARHARVQTEPRPCAHATPHATRGPLRRRSLLLEELVYILSFISSNFFCAATLAASAASAAAEAAAALALPNRPPSAPSSSCSSLHWSSSSRS